VAATGADPQSIRTSTHGNPTLVAKSTKQFVIQTIPSILLCSYQINDHRKNI